jgi:hypothetical protein
MHDRSRIVTCADFPTLVDYWFGDLEPARQEAFEEHFFGCEHCTRRLEKLVQLGSGIRSAFRAGAVRAVIPHALREAMRRGRLRLREYQIAPGTSINCTIKAEDDFVIATLQAPLAGVQRVDLVRDDGSGAPPARLEDVPFDAATGEVLLCPAPAALKKRSAFTDRVRLISVDAAAERILGEYTFVHSPERA